MPIKCLVYMNWESMWKNRSRSYSKYFSIFLKILETHTNSLVIDSALWWRRRLSQQLNLNISLLHVSWLFMIFSELTLTFQPNKIICLTRRFIFQSVSSCFPSIHSPDCCCHICWFGVAAARFMFCTSIEISRTLSCQGMYNSYYDETNWCY
jgi:hypothetical protein